MYYYSPISGERFYLRLLLTSVRGPRSFADLYVVRGVRYATYQAACIALSLTEDNKEWFYYFDKAKIFTSTKGLRTLFLTSLRQRVITDPLAIWNCYKDSFYNDLLHRLTTTQMSFPLLLLDPHYDYGLYLISEGFTDL
jgi:hypothetical protein